MNSVDVQIIFKSSNGPSKTVGLGCLVLPLTRNMDVFVFLLSSVSDQECWMPVSQLLQ